MNVPPSGLVGPLCEKGVPSPASGSTPDIARQQAGQPIDPMSQVVPEPHVHSSRSAAAEKFPGLPQMKRRAESPPLHGQTKRPRALPPVLGGHSPQQGGPLIKLETQGRSREEPAGGPSAIANLSTVPARHETVLAGPSGLFRKGPVVGAPLTGARLQVEQSAWKAYASSEARLVKAQTRQSVFREEFETQAGTRMVITSKGGSVLSLSVNTRSADTPNIRVKYQEIRNPQPYDNSWAYPEGARPIWEEEGEDLWNRLRG
jgi:hypothetical protein